MCCSSRTNWIVVDQLHAYSAHRGTYAMKLIHESLRAGRVHGIRPSACAHRLHRGIGRIAAPLRRTRPREGVRAWSVVRFLPLVNRDEVRELDEGRHGQRGFGRLLKVHALALLMSRIRSEGRGV